MSVVIIRLLMIAIGIGTTASVYSDTKSSGAVTCAAVMFIVHLHVNVVNTACGNRDNTVFVLHATANERRPGRTTTRIPLSYSSYTT